MVKSFEQAFEESYHREKEQLSERIRSLERAAARGSYKHTDHGSGKVSIVQLVGMMLSSSTVLYVSLRLCQVLLTEVQKVPPRLRKLIP